MVSLLDLGSDADSPAPKPLHRVYPSHPADPSLHHLLAVNKEKMSSGVSDAVSRLRAFIGGRVLATDRTITRLAKLLGTTSTLDTFLLTVTYTLHLAHSVLAQAGSARLEAAAAQLAERLSAKAPDALLPGETLIATIETPADSRLLRAEQSTKALTGVIDEFRTFMRLRGLLSIWTWGASVVRRPDPDPLLHRIAVVQVLACAAFQFLENVAYLATKNVVALDPKKIGRAYLWSVRMWMCHVVLDFVRLARVRQLRLRKEEKNIGDEKEAKISKEEVETWWRELYINMAWMPLIINWSFERSFAGEATVAILGGFTGWTNLRQAWKKTA